MRPTRHLFAPAAAVAALALLAPASGAAQSLDVDLFGLVPVPDTSCTIAAVTDQGGTNTSFTRQSQERSRVDIELVDANGLGRPFSVVLDVAVNCGVAWQASITSQNDGLRNNGPTEPVFINYGVQIPTGAASSVNLSTTQGQSPGAQTATADFDAADSNVELAIAGSPSGSLVPGSYSDTLSLVIRPR